MIVSVLLKCALEETRCAWMWRLSSASLKDIRKIAEEEISSQPLSFNILFALGGGRYNLQRGGDLGSGRFCVDTHVLLNFPSPSFFKIPIKASVSHPDPSACVLRGHGVPCRVAAPSLWWWMPLTGPHGSLLLRLSPRLTLLIPLLGRTYMTWSAVVICWSLHHPPHCGQVWDHVEDLLLAAVWM